MYFTVPLLIFFGLQGVLIIALFINLVILALKTPCYDPDYPLSEEDWKARVLLDANWLQRKLWTKKL